MSNFTGTFGTAVYNTLSAGTTASFLTDGTAGVYLGAGHRGATSPYVIYSYSSTPEYSSNGQIRNVRLQIQALSNGAGPAEALRVMDAVTEDFHDAQLTGVAGTVLYCRKEGQYEPFVDEAQYWHAVGVWRVSIQEPLGA